MQRNEPCTATVTPGDAGEITVALHVPGYENVATFELSAERTADGDWRVYIPWGDDFDKDRSFHIAGVRAGGTYEASNGIIYIGAPE